MKNSKKGITGVTILLVGTLLLVVAGFAAYKLSFKAKSPTTVMNANTTMQVSPTSTMPTPSGAMNNDSSVTKGTANADLDADLQIIGGKVNSANSASTDVDTSFSQQANDSVSIQ